MISQTRQLASIEKLSRLIRDQYGKELRISFITDATETKWGDSASRVSSGDLLIPIHQEGLFLGLAKIPNISDLQSSSVHAITDVVKLVLEPALYRNYLERTERNLTGIDFVESVNNELSNADADIDTAPEPSNDPSALILRAHNPHHINRAAIALHEACERWALLRLSDIGGRLGSVNEIKSLGRATLFIEDVFQLSPLDVVALAEYLDSNPGSDDPLIVIGTTQYISDIRESKVFTSDLAKKLFANMIELDRWPMKASGLQEAFRMLFQSRVASEPPQML